MAQGERGDVVAHLPGSRFVEHEIGTGPGGRHLIEAARQVFGGADGNRQQRDAQ
ncbi:MAG: hypothetical protein ACJ8AH_17565 [Stellaceae bacterium]